MPEILPNPLVEINNAFERGKQEQLRGLHGRARELAYARLYRRFYSALPSKKKIVRAGKDRWRHSKKGIAYAKKYAKLPRVLKKQRANSKRWVAALRLRVLLHYSNGDLKCACPNCGEREYGFLSLDHTNGGGCKHRKQIGRKCGAPYFNWLVKHNFPKGYQVLCYNCNLAKGFLGKCPHEK